MWEPALWIFQRIRSWNRIQGWSRSSKRSILKTWRHILMETSQLDACCLPRCVLRLHKLLPGLCVLGQVPKASNWARRHPWTSASSAPGRKASQPAKCFCRNFWLPSTPRANVCLLRYAESNALVWKHLLEKQMFVFVIDIWTVGTLPLRILVGGNIHLIWETILGSSTNQNTNQGGKRMRLKLDPVRTNQGSAALFPMFLLVSQQQHKRRVIYFLPEA